jgi:hypothetical protein
VKSTARLISSGLRWQISGLLVIFALRVVEAGRSEYSFIFKTGSLTTDILFTVCYTLQYEDGTAALNIKVAIYVHFIDTVHEMFATVDAIQLWLNVHLLIEIMILLYFSRLKYDT